MPGWEATTKPTSSPVTCERLRGRTHVEPMRGSVRNRPEEASFSRVAGQQSETPDPEGGTSRWLHEHKTALKFQSALIAAQTLFPLPICETVAGLGECLSDLLEISFDDNVDIDSISEEVMVLLDEGSEELRGEGWSER
jgi:hypothetical protein